MGKIKISSPDSNISGFAILQVTHPKKRKIATSKNTPRIISIDLLEGDDTCNGMVTQYVNLPPDEKYVDRTDIKHTDRMGRTLKCIVKFNQEGVFPFKVMVTPAETNVVYSESEKSRNPNFRYSEGEISFTTNHYGEAIIEDGSLFVSPAGNDIFTLSAKDEQNRTVTAPVQINTKRILYYGEVRMANITAPNLALCAQEYSKHGIILKHIASKVIPHRHNIDTHILEEVNALSTELQTLYDTSPEIQSKAPYCMLGVFIEYIAFKVPEQTVTVINVVGGSPNLARVNFTDDNSGETGALWHNIVPGEDWFIECYFIEENKTVDDKISIPKHNIILVESPLFIKSYYNMVDIDISDLPKSKGIIILKVNLMTRTQGGCVLPNRPFSIISVKNWWEDQSEINLNKVMVHEFGHQLQLVSNGSGILPDKHPFFYEGKGHYGPHCHNGMSSKVDNYHQPIFVEQSQCIMFGGTNNTISFCPECSQTVKKLDLSDGYHGLKHSV